MKSIQQEFSVPFHYQTYFTEGLFKPDNPLFKNTIENDHGFGQRKFIVVIDNWRGQSSPKLTNTNISLCTTVS